MWGLPEQLLATIADAVRIANWQRGRALRREFPDPIPRPGIEPTATTLGSGGISMEEMAERLGWTDALTPWRPQEQTEAEGVASE